MRGDFGFEKEAHVVKRRILLALAAALFLAWTARLVVRCKGDERRGRNAVKWVHFAPSFFFPPWPSFPPFFPPFFPTGSREGSKSGFGFGFAAPTLAR